MILFPPAKINLGLHVLKKREDGYHDIDTCMVPIPLTDVLEILPANDFKFVQTGLPVDGSSNDNLVVKAYRLLKDAYGIGDVYIHLRKNIPMGAGLGGGSADATYTLLGLNELFRLGLNPHELRGLAIKLGSDCPFFVENIPQIAQLKGDFLTPISLDLGGYYLKVVNPRIHIGTTEAYAGVAIGTPEYFLEDTLVEPMTTWKNRVVNDFEASAFTLHPSLGEIKEKLYAEGAVYASMTGSGSSMFGIYSEEPKTSFPDMFEKVVKL
ncbi:MAG: 4-(cytidine 5'-diphospho)-2-C-methyl-D-erythritol kinase [Crocinitomicaceae bacterium]|nr:4-(cytidine 5'-diphospho)-2-C-methyl-D-erythritol kinase [Crocinitomicaceae bacterium]